MFDILWNFTHLTLEQLKILKNMADDVSNGILLQHNAHGEFDKFGWCLKETQVCFSLSVADVADH
jgi:hypothetical protein